MKNEERHDLEQNELQRLLSNWRGGLKSFKFDKYTTGILLVAAIAVAGWFYYGRSQNSKAAEWVNFQNNRGGTPESMETMKSGAAGQAAMLRQGLQYNDNGMKSLATDTKLARADFEKAEKVFAELVKIAKSDTILISAMSGLANSQECQGKIKEAKASYEQLVSKFVANNEWKNHPLVKTAEDRVTQFKDENSELSLFYKNWAERMETARSDVSKKPDVNIPTPTNNLPIEPIKK